MSCVPGFNQSGVDRYRLVVDETTKAKGKRPFEVWKHIKPVVHLTKMLFTIRNLIHRIIASIGNSTRMFIFIFVLKNYAKMKLSLVHLVEQLYNAEVLGAGGYPRNAKPDS